MNVTFMKKDKDLLLFEEKELEYPPVLQHYNMKYFITWL